ncbi:MAG: DUF4292 domain-containing protein [Bacteroidetes bacterium]|nr:DUF4292 domain-containing protein [Bacteroidota bacterium]
MPVHHPVSVKKIFILLLLPLILMSSCKTSKKVVVSTPLKLRGAEVIEVFDSVLAHEFSFEWLVLNASVDYTSRNETESFDIHVRMRKDSAIWISITPLLGIEAARVLVTRDGMQILDRVHKTYTVHDFGFLDSLLKTHLNFEIMQAVLVGNYFPYLKNEKLKSVYEEDSCTILSTLNKRKLKRAMEDKDPNKPIVQDFWISTSYRITKSRMEDERLNRSLEATYSDFTEAGSKLIPNNILVTIAAVNPAEIKVAYSKIAVDETVTFPFTVPDKYERK